MPSVLIVAALWGALQAAAPADAFDRRVQQGRQAEQDSTGQAYQARLWARLNPLMTNALTNCLASLPAPDKAPFTLVADIDPQGRPWQVQVRPQTSVASCFAPRFAGMTLPAPPPIERAGYPIEIDITLTH
jgi:hypothetical protein